LNHMDRLNYFCVPVEIQTGYVNIYKYLVDRTCLRVSPVIYLNKMMATTNTFSQNGRQRDRTRYLPNTIEWSGAEMMWLHFNF
jgi:hypothetical protein